MFDNRPYFRRMNRSVADSVAEKVIELDNTKSLYIYAPDDSKVKSPKYLDLSKSVDGLVSQESVSFNPIRNLGTVTVKATGLGLVANVIVSYFSKDYNWGYVAESAAYSAYFAYDYWKTNRKAGIPKVGVSIDMVVLGVASFLLSTWPYRLGRNELIDYSIKNDLVGFIPNPDAARAFAAGVTQLVLLPFWLKTLQLVKKGIDYTDNKFKFKSYVINSKSNPTI